MRTTIDINNQLYRAARKRAAEEGIPLRELVERALRLQLAPRAQRRRKYSLSWRTERGDAAPKVDIADRKALLDYMDEHS
jgi:hypothetical protein